MNLQFEYGHGFMSANLPDTTDVFIPGETVPDPQCLPQDWDSLYEATLESIINPMGMPPLRELAAPGKTVVFVIPDIVKGGTQPTSHRKVSIKACLDELYAGGVEKKDILLLISNGLHPRATVAEMKQILGEELFNEFYYSGQLTSHDSEDYEHMVDLGYTKRGDPVLMNKYVYECDIPILIGHTQGNPYGGYSGGYKHRQERDFFGFRTVRTNQLDTQNDDRLFRYSVQTYGDNRDYYRHDLVTAEALYDAEGRILQGSTYEYDLRKVSDEVRFPALASVVQTTYD